MKMKKILAENRKAYHNYFVLEEIEAGIVLKGSEVKSAKNGQISIAEGYAKVEDGEVFLYNVNITPYKMSTIEKPDPKRKRKLLLTKREIKRLFGKTQIRGLTLIPLKVYINERGFIKILLGLCKGKKLVDKREELKKRDMQRMMRREGKWVF